MAHKRISDFFGEPPATRKSPTEEQLIPESIPGLTSTSMPAFLKPNTNSATETSNSNSSRDPAAPLGHTAVTAGGLSPLAELALQTVNFALSFTPA